MDLASLTQQKATDAALTAADKAVAAALQSIKESTRVQTAMLTERANRQNEWRQTVTDILATAMPRVEAEQIATRMSQQIAEITVAMQAVPTRVELDAINSRITELTQWRDRVEGQGLGAKENRAGIYAAIAAIPVVLAVVLIIVDLASRG